MDFKWSPFKCYSCQSNSTCKTCIYCPNFDVNLRYLILYTELPELWKIFNDVLKLNNVTESGFSLLGIRDYMYNYPKVLQTTHSDFWLAMTYMLERANNEFTKKLAVERAKIGGR